MSNVDLFREMGKRYTKGMDLSDEQLATLNLQLQQMKEKVNPRSASLAKGTFDAVDTALFGLVPNQWRPQVQGEEYLGESDADLAGGNIGSVLGLGAGIWGGTLATGAALRGAGKLTASAKAFFAKKKANDIASTVYKGTLMPHTPKASVGTNIIPSGPAIPMGQGAPLLGAARINPFDPRRRVMIGPDGVDVISGARLLPPATLNPLPTTMASLPPARTVADFRAMQTPNPFIRDSLTETARLRNLIRQDEVRKRARRATDWLASRPMT